MYYWLAFANSFPQVDINPEEFHNSVKSEVAVHSDIKPFVELLSQKLAEKKVSLQPASNGWWQQLKKKQESNVAFVEVRLQLQIACISARRYRSTFDYSLHNVR